MSEKITGTFLELVQWLEPVEFIGLAKLLGVPIIDSEGKEKDFLLILSELVKKFEGLKRKKRRELLKVLQEVKKENLKGKKEGDCDGEIPS